MRTETEMVAYALEVQSALLPYVTKLLADFDELGSDAELIVEVLAGLDLPSDSLVIDLGCGKGAVAVEIAKSTGGRVKGIELFEPFIAQCQHRATEAGVAERCEFIHGNVAKLAGELPPADAVVFAALGDVLGPLDQTMRIIRQYVKPGGVIVVADDYLADGGSTDFPGFEDYVSRDQTVARLTACGDQIAAEVPEPFEDGNDDESDLIRKRADDLKQRHPELADELDLFVRNQYAEVQFLRDNMVSMIWAVRRTAD